MDSGKGALGRILPLLPAAETIFPAPAGGITLDGFLVRSSTPGTIGIAVGDVCLTFRKIDIIDVIEYQLPAGVQPGAGIPVRLQVCRGAPLQAVSATAPYRAHLLRCHRPFSLTTRPFGSPSPNQAEYQAKERAFLQERGLLDDEASS